MEHIKEIISYWSTTMSERHVLLSILNDWMILHNQTDLEISELGIKVNETLQDVQVSYVHMYQSGLFALESASGQYFDIDRISNADLEQVVLFYMKKHMSYEPKMKKVNCDEETCETSTEDVSVCEKCKERIYDITDYKILEEIKPFIIDICGVEDIKMEHHLVNELGFDSLDILDIITKIENELDVTIDFDEMDDIHTVYDIVYKIKRKHKAR